MRRILGGCTLAVTASSALVMPLDAQLGYGTDITYRTRYEWRGLTRANGSVVQQDLFASWQRGLTYVTVGGWANVYQAASPLSSTNPTPTKNALGRRWFGQIEGWAEASTVIAGADLALGATGYSFYDTAQAVQPGPLPNTWELYGRLALMDLPVIVPAVAAWYDVDEVKGAYVETSLTLRIPIWANVMVPVGSLDLNGLAGFSLGQEVNADAPTEVAYFEDSGLTHIDLSTGLVIGYVPLGFLNASVYVDFHVQYNHDPRTKITAGGSKDWITWLGITVSLLGPRCQPSPRICGS